GGGKGIERIGRDGEQTKVDRQAGLEGGHLFHAIPGTAAQLAVYVHLETTPLHPFHLPPPPLSKSEFGRNAAPKVSPPSPPESDSGHTGRGNSTGRARSGLAGVSPVPRR